jgi:addiction module HigA family antidote
MLCLQTLYEVLKEKQPVTPGMALRLGKRCGNGPDLWLNLQKRYDLHQAQQELGAKIEKNSDVGGRLKARIC